MGLGVAPCQSMAVLVALSIIASTATTIAYAACPCPNVPKCGIEADVFDKCYVALRKGEEVATIREGNFFKTAEKQNCCEMSKDCICEMRLKIQAVDITTKLSCLDTVDCSSWKQRAPKLCGCQVPCLLEDWFGRCTEKFRKGENLVPDSEVSAGRITRSEMHDCCEKLEDRCKCLAKDIIVNTFKQAVPNVSCLKNLRCQ